MNSFAMAFMPWQKEWFYFSDGIWRFDNLKKGF
jgi:hypothetical protein